jgi:hypothetical protein
MRAWPILIVGALMVAGCGKQAARQPPARYGAGQCGGLAPGWLRPDPDRWKYDIIEARIDLGRDGSLRWNSYPIDEQGLLRNLKGVSSWLVVPDLDLVVNDGASCDRVAKVRKLFAVHSPCGHGEMCYEFTLSKWKPDVPIPPRVSAP